MQLLESSDRPENEEALFVAAELRAKYTDQLVDTLLSILESSGDLLPALSTNIMSCLDKLDTDINPRSK